MIDRYLHGKVDRISPEAPVPIVRMTNTENRLGGAANVALNIKAMGATPILCSVIGEDSSGDNFESLLSTEGISAEGIIRSRERQTTVKTRVLSSNQHLLRVDQEDTKALSEDEASRLLKKISEVIAMEKIDLILFQDYNKGVLSAEVIKAILTEANTLNISTVVDPKYHNFLTYQQVTLFKPNLKEIREAVPFEISIDTTSLKAASDYLRNKIQHTNTLITLGDKGIFLDDGTQQLILPTQPRSIADVCGAGDTVVSIAALATAIKLDLLEIARLANLAGGQVCERVGVVPVDKVQLRKEYEL
jgi:rfaE bifunctional protein kinase chain/domain